MKSDFVHLWVHILIKANHKGNEWMYKNEIFQVKRGQFITSRKSLSAETGINTSKIDRILKCFESEQQIEQQNLFTSRLVSILNYEIYQTSEPQVNSKRTASEPQVNTNKNDKNVKNDNNKGKVFLKPSFIDIKNYCFERKNSVPPQSFIDHYDAVGWKVGNHLMKDWKACIRTWENRENGKPKYNPSL